LNKIQGVQESDTTMLMDVPQLEKKNP